MICRSRAVDSDLERMVFSELVGGVECASVCGRFLAELSVRSDGCPPATATTPPSCQQTPHWRLRRSRRGRSNSLMQLNTSVDSFPIDTFLLRIFLSFFSESYPEMYLISIPQYLGWNISQFLQRNWRERTTCVRTGRCFSAHTGKREKEDICFRFFKMLIFWKTTDYLIKLGNDHMAWAKSQLKHT